MSLERSLLKAAAAAFYEFSADTCSAPGCDKKVSKPGHKLCYQHWKANNEQIAAKPQSPSSTLLLSATSISEKLAIPKNKINPILAELGLLNKEQNGWVATKRGIAFGAVQKKDSQTNVSYVLWPQSILKNEVFLTTIEDIKGNSQQHFSSVASSDQGFRDKFRSGAQHRTTDGHWVRSKAEVLIDNWLYIAGIVHAYERRVPIEEELYCDFYVPAGKVYIEYWGYENDSEYVARQKVKQELYHKYQLNLIELSDEHIRNLDDYLPKMLIKFGVNVS